MKKFMIPIISCVITIILREGVFYLFNIKTPNIVLDFVIFAVIFISIFTILEKILDKKNI